MAHKSLIGGTVYEKYGGTDLIDGTVYAKNYGKTLVGGTVYEVGFAKPMALVKIDTYYSSENSFWYVTIDGVNHSVSGVFEVPIGTQIYCYTSIDDYDDDGYPVNLSAYGISINGTYIKAETYNYTVNSDVVITAKSGRYGESMVITEIPEGYALVNITYAPGQTQYANLRYNEVVYSSITTFMAKIGDTIQFIVGANGGGAAEVYVNNAVVLQKTVTSSIVTQYTYQYKVVGEVKIKMYYSVKSGQYGGSIYITEI